jgi:D-arabinose 1-dehydrogenase-like Zn-dependent alcohol dehydrogenase
VEDALSDKLRSYQLVKFGDHLEEVQSQCLAPVGSEVVLRVVASGVCHSDLHICEGFHDLGGGKKISLEGRVLLPLTPGHEIAGEVIHVGPDAKDVSVGDMVLICSWIGCSTCSACLAAQDHLCRAPRFLGLNRDGGYANLVTVPHPRHLIALDGLDPQRAAPLVCSGLTTFSALKKLDANVSLKKQPIVVIGAGGLGLMSLQILKMMGGQGAVVAELDAKKRQAALKGGAIAAVDPHAAGAIKSIRKAAGGDVGGVIDFVGSGETASLGFDLLGQGGKLVIVGLFGGAVTLSVPLIPMKSAKIEGSYIGSPAELQELIALVKRKGMPQVPLDVRALSEVNAALSDLRQGRIVGRVILVP